MTKHIITIIGVLVAIISSCTWDRIEPTFDCSDSTLSLILQSSEDTSCGLNAGSLSVQANGGEAPYSYTINNTSSSTGEFTNLAPGAYTVVVTDNVNCMDQIEAVIQNSDGVNITNIALTDAGCDTNQGRITIEASGGTEPYQYSIGSQTSSNATFDGLSRGSYDVRVTDQAGCSTEQTVIINTGISFSGSIKSIIDTNCAISGCHNGSISPDLRSLSVIQSRAQSIKSRTASGSMPKGFSMSQSNIDKIACWVDDGALNN